MDGRGGWWWWLRRFNKETHCCCQKIEPLSFFLFCRSLTHSTFSTHTQHSHSSAMDSKDRHEDKVLDESIGETYPRNEFEAYQSPEPPNLWKVFKSQVTTREGWWGDFDWMSMCLPSVFVKKEKRHTPFWGLNSRLPLGLAAVMGFQHSLAMVSGTI